MELKEVLWQANSILHVVEYACGIQYSGREYHKILVMNITYTLLHQLLSYCVVHDRTVYL